MGSVLYCLRGAEGKALTFRKGLALPREADVPMT